MIDARLSCQPNNNEFMNHTAITTALLAALALAASQARAAITPDSCDSKTYQTVQHPAAAAFDARAVWLDRRVARWPGAQAGGVFRLYHSPLGSIAAPKGGKVSGAGGSILLDPFEGALPAAVA